MQSILMKIMMGMNLFPIIPFVVTGIMLFLYTKNKTIKKRRILIQLAPIAWILYSIYNLIPKYGMLYTITELVFIIPVLLILSINLLITSVIKSIE